MWPYAGAELVRPAVGVQGQLELLVLPGHAVEVVRRLVVAVADDRRLLAELEAERLVELAAPVGVVMRSIVCRYGSWARSYARPRRASADPGVDQEVDATVRPALTSAFAGAIDMPSRRGIVTR